MRATFLDQLRSREADSRWSAIVFWLEVFRDTVAEGLGERVARWTGRSRPPPPRRPLRDRSSGTLIGFLETAVTELRLAARSLRRRPVFASAVVLILGTGLAGATVVWTTVHDVLLEPLGYAQEDRLVGIWMKSELPDGTVRPRFALSDAQIAALRDHAGTLDGLAYIHMATGSGTVLRREGMAPRRVRYAPVSPNFFSLLGVTALHGRTLVPEDRGRNVVVLSERAWGQHFGRDPDVVGRAIDLGSERYEVVGILPSSFRWLGFEDRMEFWMPRELEESRAVPFFFNVVARRRADATPARVEAEASGIILGVHDEMVRRLDDPPEPFATVVPIREAHLGEVSPQLKVLGGAVGFVLFLAVVNVTLLLLMRVTGRSEEAAVRVALGGGPGRVAAPILAEASLLTGVAWLLGMAGAAGGLAYLRSFAPSGIPRIGLVGFSWEMVGIGAALAVAVTLLVSVLPAVLIGRTSVRGLLNSAATPVTEGIVPRSLRNPLVVAEVALAVVLLSGAGLMARSFVELRSADLGFQTGGILQGKLVLPTEPLWAEVEGRGGPGDVRMLRITPEMAQLRRTLRERLVGHPQVSEVALAQHTPLGGRYGGFTPFVREGREDEGMPPGQTWIASNAVDPGFLPFMGVELLAGRWLTERDDEVGPPVALISEALARRFWPGEDPVGDRFSGWSWIPDGEGGYRQEERWVTVVGVVRSLREWEYRRRDETVYRTLAHAYPTDGVVPRGTRGPQLSLFVRYDGEAGPVARHMRSTVADVLPAVPVDDLRTMEEVAATWLREPRFYTGLLGGFGLLAVVLASGGIAAVIGFGVSRRTREIGLRMALGGGTPEVLELVARETLALVGLGIVVGLGASMAVVRVLESLLYEVEPHDPVTLVATVLLFVAVALLAAWIPARNALAVDPAEALRYE